MYSSCSESINPHRSYKAKVTSVESIASPIRCTSGKNDVYFTLQLTETISAYRAMQLWLRDFQELIEQHCSECPADILLDAANLVPGAFVLAEYSHQNKRYACRTRQFELRRCTVLSVDFISDESLPLMPNFIIQNKNNKDEELSNHYHENNTKETNCKPLLVRLRCVDTGAEFEGLLLRSIEERIQTQVENSNQHQENYNNKKGTILKLYDAHSQLLKHWPAFGIPAHFGQNFSPTQRMELIKFIQQMAQEGLEIEAQFVFTGVESLNSGWQVRFKLNSTDKITRFGMIQELPKEVNRI